MHFRRQIDARLGRAGWLVVFVLSAAALPVFEIPMVRLLHLWHYYQRPAFLLGGVPWSNIWYSGLLTTSCYGALRLAARWAPAVRPVVVAGPALAGRESWWQSFALGVAAIWSAFYFSMLIQMIWYGATQPWVPTPRPF